jgi:hypothetical protein
MALNSMDWSGAKQWKATRGLGWWGSGAIQQESFGPEFVVVYNSGHPRSI